MRKSLGNGKKITKISTNEMEMIWFEVVNPGKSEKRFCGFRVIKV